MRIAIEFSHPITLINFKPRLNSGSFVLIVNSYFMLHVNLFEGQFYPEMKPEA
jgi:hypothetical protein